MLYKCYHMDGYTPADPGRLWASDLTCIETGSGVSRFALMTDVYSRMAVGRKQARALHSPDVLSALKMALGRPGGKHSESVRPSARGSGYCCRDYVHMPDRRNIRIRMTGSGHPFDSVVAGPVCGILKTGRMYDGKPGAWLESSLLTGKITDLCHHRTPRRRIGYTLPVRVHQTGMKPERMWKNDYRGRNVPLDGNTGKNKNSEPEQNSMKNNCPEKETRTTLLRGNGASATPLFHFPEAKRKVGRKNFNPHCSIAL